MGLVGFQRVYISLDMQPVMEDSFASIVRQLEKTEDGHRTRLAGSSKCENER